MLSVHNGGAGSSSSSSRASNAPAGSSPAELVQGMGARDDHHHSNDTGIARLNAAQQDELKGLSSTGCGSKCYGGTAPDTAASKSTHAGEQSLQHVPSALTLLTAEQASRSTAGPGELDIPMSAGRSLGSASGFPSARSAKETPQANTSSGTVGRALSGAGALSVGVNLPSGAVPRTSSIAAVGMRGSAPPAAHAQLGDTRQRARQGTHTLQRRASDSMLRQPTRSSAPSTGFPSPTSPSNAPESPTSVAAVGTVSTMLSASTAAASSSGPPPANSRSSLRRAGATSLRAARRS